MPIARKYQRGKSVRSSSRLAYAIENLESRTLLNAADLDPTFGVGGRVQTSLTGNGLEQFNSAVVQSDGKLVVAGHAFGYYLSDFGIVARYNTNGTLDTTFGSGGQVVFSSAFQSFFYSIALQSDGKIVVGGSINTAQQQQKASMFVSRFTTAGALDTTFNATGTEMLSFSGGVDRVSAIGVQSDGKIVLAGGAGGASLVRLTTTGALDSTFGTGGKFTTSSLSTINAIAFDSAGRVVADGTSSSATAVARFTTSGALDSTFINAGVFTTTVGSGDTPAGIKIQTDGKIVVGGSSSGNFYAIRLTTAGTPDSTFAGGTGIFKGAITGTCRTLGITSTGAIMLAGGTALTNSSGPVSVMRITSAGVLDTTFNGTGTAILGSGVNVYGGVVKATGVVDIVGSDYASFGASVFQVSAGGTLDTSFGTTGNVTVNIPVPVDSELQRIAIQPDGKVIIASTIDAGFDYSSYVLFPPPNPRYFGSIIYLTRYTAAGVLDSTFGTGGIASMALGTSCKLYGMQLLASGDIVVAGSYIDASSHSQGVLKYFLPNGTPDTSYGTAGQLSIAQFSGHTSTFFSALTQAPNGDLLLAGSYFDTTVTYQVVAIKSTGALDTAYGAGGVITASGQIDYIAADASGNVVTYTYQHLIRYLMSGAVDPTLLSGAGSSGPTPNPGTHGMLIQPDGKIILIGGGGAFGLVIQRFASNGGIDGGFGSGGNVSLGNPSKYLNSAYVLPNGNIIIAGEQSLSSFADGYVAELDSHGVLVPGFGTSGSVAISFGEVTPITVDFGEIAMRPNGRLVIAGIEANNQMVAQFQGTVPDAFSGTAGNDAITLTQSTDHQSITWMLGGQVGSLPITDAAGLTINGNGGSDTITLLGSNALPNTLHLNGTFTISGLTGTNPLANTTLDIGGGPIYISYAGPALDPISAVRGYLKNGYATGAWNGAPTGGTGVITSAKAAADVTHTTGIGYADSADGLVPLPANTLELKYTLYGDTGLTGTVGFTDFMRMTQHYTTASGATWGRGDFDYDGAVGATDFNLLKPNYGLTLPTPAPAPAVALPQSPAASNASNGATSVSPLTQSAPDVGAKKHVKAKHRHK